MKSLKQHQFWVSLTFGLILFAGTFPFYHDMYIPEVFTVVCICLNALSALLLSKLLYCALTHRIDAAGRGKFVVGTVLQAVFHAVFSIMNWGSWLFIGLSVIVFIFLAVTHLKEKTQ